MSIKKIPQVVQIGTTNEFVIDALKMMGDTQISHQKHKQDINNIQDLLKEPFEVSEPTGLKRLGATTLLQIGDNIERKLTIPSATYWLQADNPAISVQIAKVIRDGVETVMEMGGFEAVMTEKPSGFRGAIDYGDTIVRIGTDGSGKIPIKFDLVLPDQVYVDSNATVINSVTGARKVTRCLIIYSYDYDQAAKMYPNKKFGLGEIPDQNSYMKDFNKTWEQETENERKVQIAHYFDIGGEKPVYIVFAGTQCTILEKAVGEEYPFIDGQTGEPYPPIDQFKLIDSREGFWNYGFGHLFYKYSITKRQLLNKAVSQSMNSMNDTQVVNVGRNKGGEILARIRDAREMGKNGQMGIIINDTGEPIQVSKLQADQYENSLRLLNEWLDQEVRRFGINIDAIREQKSTTATQILAEAEVEDEVAAGIITRNTEFFKRMHYRTMDFILEYVDADDSTPIWTTIKLPTGIINRKTGQEAEAPLVVTLGEIRQLLEKYRKGIWVEVNTKTGVKERDGIKTAKALLAMRTSQNPLVQNEAYKMLLQANNIQIDSDILNQPQGGQVATGEAGKAAEQFMKEQGGALNV